MVQDKKHSIPHIIQHYNFLLIERKKLADAHIWYPYRSPVGFYRGDGFHKRRINQLRRQVNRNIKRIENVIEKLCSVE